MLPSSQDDKARKLMSLFWLRSCSLRMRVKPLRKCTSTYISTKYDTRDSYIAVRVVTGGVRFVSPFSGGECFVWL